MERGSDKHGPRTDEEMEQETQSIQKGAPVDSRVEEFRVMEPVEEEEEEEEPEVPSGGDRSES